METGWIKIHRKILDKGFFKDSEYFHVWMYLLLNANHKDKEFIFNGQVVFVKRGQLITGRKVLAAAVFMSESKVQRLLQAFEKMKIIEQQNRSKYRLISILNYDKYQSGEQELNSKRTATEQLLNTNNNVNNENKIINTPGIDPDMIMTEQMREESEQLWRDHDRQDLQAEIEFKKFVSHHLIKRTSSSSWIDSWKLWSLTALNYSTNKKRSVRIENKQQEKSFLDQHLDKNWSKNL